MQWQLKLLTSHHHHHQLPVRNLFWRQNLHEASLTRSRAHKENQQHLHLYSLIAEDSWKGSKYRACPFRTVTFFMNHVLDTVFDCNLFLIRFVCRVIPNTIGGRTDSVKNKKIKRAVWTWRKLFAEVDWTFAKTYYKDGKANVNCHLYFSWEVSCKGRVADLFQKHFL